MKLERKTKPYLLSASSELRLRGVNEKLRALVAEILHYMDISVIEGLRSLETQKQYVARGVSKTMASKHITGDAIDIYPYPVPKKGKEIDSSSERWDEMALVVYYCAGKLGIENLEWGGTWKSLVDKPHFQLNEENENV